tara:strand:+ start:371 stop:511 length:141 start_codon:yes stop_codon:yes gene_type:complete
MVVLINLPSVIFLGLVVLGAQVKMLFKAAYRVFNGKKIHCWRAQKI